MRASRRGWRAVRGRYFKQNETFTNAVKYNGWWKVLKNNVEYYIIEEYCEVLVHEESSEPISETKENYYLNKLLQKLIHEQNKRKTCV